MDTFYEQLDVINFLQADTFLFCLYNVFDHFQKFTKLCVENEHQTKPVKIALWRLLWHQTFE